MKQLNLGLLRAINSGNLMPYKWIFHLLKKLASNVVFLHLRLVRVITQQRFQWMMSSTWNIKQLAIQPWLYLTIFRSHPKNVHFSCTAKVITYQKTGMKAKQTGLPCWHCVKKVDYRPCRKNCS